MPGSKQLRFPSFLLFYLALLVPGSGIAAINQSGSLAYIARFIENKGQLKNERGESVPHVLFKMVQPGMDLYVTTRGLTLVMVEGEPTWRNRISPEDALYQEQKDRSWRLFQRNHKEAHSMRHLKTEILLKGARISVQNLIKQGESEDHYNFFYAHCPQGIYGVKAYEKLIFKSIYPGIDWILYTSAKGFKYDFVLHPGADPKQIQLLYRGMTQGLIQGAQEAPSLLFQTLMGGITDGPLKVWVQGNLDPIPARYTLNSGKKDGIQEFQVGFNIPNYPRHQSWVIDPELTWATYYGGASGYEGTYAIDVDGSNAWATGYVYSGDFPTYPKVGAYYQPNTGGPNDVFIVQFDDLSRRVWSTYYGGAGNDGGSSIHSDGAHVYVTGFTASSNFPLQNPGGGAYFQEVALGLIGTYPFILQFTKDGVRKWATYYGGGSSEMGTSVISDGSTVWLAGFTGSTNFPLKDPGNGAWYQGTKNGTGTDLFIARFESTGKQLWSTFYGGNSSEGGLYPTLATPNFALDDSSIWLCGYTASTDFPTYTPDSNAWFKAGSAGQDDAYILRFNKQNQRIYASYLGGDKSDQCIGVFHDGEHLWLTGNTNSTNFPTLNPGGGAWFQNTLKGSKNAFITKMDQEYRLQWSTYFGNTGGNGSFNAIASDGKTVWASGEISSGFPVMNSNDCAPYNSSSAGSGDLVISRFSVDGLLLYSTYYGGAGRDWCTGADINKTTGCAWFTGEWTGNSMTVPTKDPGNGAYYQPVGATGSDEIFFMKFCECPCPLPVPKVTGPRFACQGDSITLKASGGTSYKWNGTAGTDTYGFRAFKDTVIVVTVTNSCGSRNLNYNFTVHPKPTYAVIGDTAICLGQSLNLGGSKITGQTYTWTSSQDTFYSEKSNPSITPDSTHWYKLVVRTPNSCADSTQFTVSVFPVPVASFSYNQTPGGLEFEFSGTTQNGVKDWWWDFGDRSTPGSGQKIKHTYTQEDTFYVTLIITNGCGKDTFTTPVGVKNLPNDTTGLTNLPGIGQLRAYPVPLQKELFLEFYSVGEGPLQVKFLDITGRSILRTQVFRVQPGLQLLGLEIDPQWRYASQALLLEFKLNGNTGTLLLK